MQTIILKLYKVEYKINAAQKDCEKCKAGIRISKAEYQIHKPRIERIKGF